MFSKWPVVPTYPIDVFIEKRGGGVVQRQVLYLGEPNDNQRAGWVRTIEAFSGEKPKAKQLALFPDDCEELSVMACETVRVQLDKIELRHPLEWGASMDCICEIFWNWTHFGNSVCRQAVKGQTG